MKKLGIGLLLTYLWIGSGYAFSQGYQINAIVADFQLKDVTDKTVSLSDFKLAKGYILIFTCNTCPFSKLYEERINSLNLKYESLGYPVIAINPNDAEEQPEDSFENMKKRAREKNFSFPYLYDEGQKVTSLYKPTKTPHVFLIKKENNNLKVVYTGAIDDNSGNASAVKEKFLEIAVDELLSGKIVSNKKTKPVGCSVK